jgi:mRNA interferase MazF
MKRGQIWWTNLGPPRGSEPGYRRPAVIVSANEFNASAVQTVIVVFLTTNAARAKDPGNVWLTAKQTGLPQNCTLNVTQISTVDRRILYEFVGHLPDVVMARVDDGLRLVLGLAAR